MKGWWVGLGAASPFLLVGALPRPAPRSAPGAAAPTPLLRAMPEPLERCWARLQRRTTAARRDGQLPELLERIASGLRAGLALGPALMEAAQGAPHPLAIELTPLALALRHGAPLEAELERWATTPSSSPDVRLVAASLDLARQAGGSTSRAVDRVAATLRERRELQAEARALATQARASAGVLAVAPVVFTALVATIEPGAAAVLFTTPLGVGCLVAGAGLDALGAAWMGRIVRSAW